MNKLTASATLAIFFVILVSLPGQSFAFWRPCEGGLRPPDRVESPDCTPTVCHVQRGGMMRASVFISSPQVHHELLVVSYVWIFGIQIRLPAVPPHDNGCNSLFLNGIQVSCPTQPNVQYEWKVEQEVPQATPAFQNSRVQFQLWDRGTLEGCLEVTATVV